MDGGSGEEANVCSQGSDLPSVGRTWDPSVLLGALGQVSAPTPRRHLPICKNKGL